jgi:predicted MPP superfamily phosphohydrolase
VKFFLVAFLSIYGGLHLHFFIRLRNAFLPGGAAIVVMVFFLMVGLFAPIIVRVAEMRGCHLTARFIALPAFYWMAFLLIFCSVSLCVWLYGFFSPLSPRMRFAVPAVAAAILTLYGVYEARGPRTEFLTVRTNKIPKEIGRIRVVQISDVHIGGAKGSDHIPEIVRAIRDAAPDVLVSTGDFVDGQGPYVADAVRMFSSIRPRLGKFAVTGNHEVYLGMRRSVAFHKEAGFTLLRNRVETIGGVVNIGGVDDPGGAANGNPHVSDRDVLAGGEKGLFTILLKHRPIVEEAAVSLFDLQLSGHTHGGQIFPFHLATRLLFPRHAGSYPLASGALLHVSRGTGTWGPPVRVFSPPEITVIDILSRVTVRNIASA